MQQHMGKEVGILLLKRLLQRHSLLYYYSRSSGTGRSGWGLARLALQRHQRQALRIPVTYDGWLLMEMYPGLNPVVLRTCRNCERHWRKLGANPAFCGPSLLAHFLGAACLRIPDLSLRSATCLNG